MSNSDRRQYLTATVLDQDFLDQSHDNLENQIELIVDIETPTGFIRASDRPKYVDGVFYDNRLVFPLIGRTIGEWLSPETELSVLKLELNNADGLYDEFLMGGANYDGFIGRTVTVKLGIRDVGSTYTTVFRGTVSDIGGFARTQKSIIITTRDDYEKLLIAFPTVTMTPTAFPSITDDVAGVFTPVIYGDWTTAGDPQKNNASVPAFITNGGASVGVPGVLVELFICQNDIQSLDTSGVILVRGDFIVTIALADISLSFPNDRQFKVIQNTGNTLVDGANFILEDGDLFFVKVVGEDLGAYDDNPVWQARQILLDHANVTVGELDANWATFRDKAAISALKSRVWINEPESALTYVNSLLEQVRLESFISRDLKIKLNSLHFDDAVAAPTFRLNNFDLEFRSIKPALDTRNNWNRAQGLYNFLPDVAQTAFRTSVYRNQAAITQQKKEISKGVSFPNLYVKTDVTTQLIEMIKLASSAYEHIFMTLTWRSLLLDIGDFVFLDVKIGSTEYSSVPCSIREIGYDPEGIKLPVRLWSYQVIPFTGNAGVTGSVGGEFAVITEEV